MLRVGIIDFANTLPLFHALSNHLIPHDATFTIGNPFDINKALLSGDLDIASISATHFLDHRLEYVLLSDLGVGATDETADIRLFSKKSPSEMDKRPIFISSKNPLSLKIFETICASFWRINPAFTHYPDKVEKLFHQDLPFIITGDECLKLMEKYPDVPSIDLISTWYKLTKKCSLFTVIATRNETFSLKQQEVIEFQKCLEQAFAWSQNNMKVIIDEASKKTGCGHTLLQKYYSAVEYQLTPKHFHGLNYLSML